MPIPPSIILFINFLMDTFASLVLASELPKDDYAILKMTKPFRKDDSLITNNMIFTICSSTLYQQIVMFIIFYSGLFFTDHEHDHNHDDYMYSAGHCQHGENGTAQSYSFIYHCFFTMQIFNIFNCRISFEDESALHKLARAVKTMFKKKQEDDNFSKRRDSIFGKQQQVQMKFKKSNKVYLDDRFSNSITVGR